MRNLRSYRANALGDIAQNAPSSSLAGLRFTTPEPATKSTAIKVIATGSRLPGISSTEQKLLRQKQKRLVIDAVALRGEVGDAENKAIENALEATLIFSQYEAGTAVCVSPDGWVLTCAHCFGDTGDEIQSSDKRRWLLFYTGLVVQAECKVWDVKKDLALLKIIAIETDVNRRKDEVTCSFPFVKMALKSPAIKTSIICIGQPGMDDLESSSEAKTKFKLVELSFGKYRGMMAGVDHHDNSDIGTMKHDAWTYWGHSGAPLLIETSGTLIGLHSSWDDQTGMRHGVPLVAIRSFLEQQVHLLGIGEAEATPSVADEVEVIVISD